MAQPTTGRIAGIDYGTVRVGIAITDAARTLASPLEQYQRGDEAADAKFFGELVQQESIQHFVVGLPVHLSGLESQKSIEARQFGAWLEKHTGIPVVFYDERFTSKEADELLADSGLTKDQRKSRRDMLAAQILLRDYLAAGQPPTEPPQPLDD